MKRPIKVVTIGGGSGQYVLLFGLRDLLWVDITSVVSMVDSGGSTGRLRDELGVLPPGDILKCIMALSPFHDSARRILQARFNTESRLAGHNAGNMLLSMLSQYTGSFPAGVEALGDILNVRGRVLPVTTDRATLVAELTDNTKLYGEAAIDIPRGRQREKIRDVFLVPHHSENISVYPPVLRAIREADFIIIGPGDLFTSIIPNFLVPGITRSINEAHAKIIYVVNLMTKFGETSGFSVLDFINKIECYLEKRIDYAVINKKKPPADLLIRYGEEKSTFVAARPEMEKMLSPRKMVTADLLDINQVIRHNPRKLAAVIDQIMTKEELTFSSQKRSLIKIKTKV